MIKHINPKMRTLFCIICVLGASSIISIQMKQSKLQVCEVEENKGKMSKVEITSNLKNNNDVKMYQREETSEFKEVKSKENKKTLIKETDTFELETEDKAKPNNVSNIKTSILDNYIILDFEKAKDNGTKYEYYFEKDNVKTEPSKIYSESGIKGYSYVIDNEPNTEAGYEINKKNSEPILYSNIEWNKDYYLHIRTCDNNNNFSDNLTYKINLPSKGVRMRYLDINNNTIISPEETIVGNVNNEYNVSEFCKKLDGYQLVKTEGEEKGKLKKEKININYLYAKTSNIIIKYLDKLTGKEIEKSTCIQGYEGKEYKINPKKISGYQYIGNILQGKMTQDSQEICLYYNEIGNLKVSYVNEVTGEKILPDEINKNLVGEEYHLTDKEIPGYKFSRIDGKKNGIISAKENNIIYYYKKEVKLVVKAVDIDTNKILDKEEFLGYEGDKITVKSKKFEGYVLEDKNIIDELLDDEGLEEGKEGDKNKEIKNDEETNIKNTIQQYDILLGNSDTEYIIYYKRK